MSSTGPHHHHWAAARQVPSADPLECGREGSVFWARPEAGEAFAGCGEAHVLQGAPAEVLGAIEANPVRWLTEAPEIPGPWFGGIAFDSQRPRAEVWAGFGPARFILPEVALATCAGRSWAVAFVSAGTEEEARSHLARRLEEAESVLDGARERPIPPAEQVLPVRSAAFREAASAQWRDLVSSALQAFDRGALEKVVGARELVRVLPDQVTARQILRRLRILHPGCTTFLFTGSDGARFLGATPETLLRIEDGLLQTEALAGTLAPGQQEPTPKELREHAYVIDGIRTALVPSCSWIEAEAHPALHGYGHLVHLRTRIVAKLRAEVSLAQLVAALHPTPAVGGTPRADAIAFLRDREGFDRGWYAGAVGWAGQGRAHLCVGLRSALIRGAELRAFAGAGLVAGSDPEAEWIETERKAAAVLGAVEGSR